MYGDRQRAWFWDIYQPPKAFETAELATLAECIAKTQGDRPPDVRRGRISFSRKGKRLSLSGSAGFNGGTLLQRLSVTLPKDVSFAPERTCSRAVAREVTLRDLKRGRCSVVMAGMLDDPEHNFWFAIAGPKRNVWLRARLQSGKLVGFGTGRVKAAKSGYGQTLVAEVGQIGLNAELVGLQAEHLRSSRSCRNGLRYKIELVTEAGTLKTGKKARCPGR
jgi:hypothetical protein